jgi:hypothetical protein
LKTSPISFRHQQKFRKRNNNRNPIPPWTT